MVLVISKARGLDGAKASKGMVSIVQHHTV